MSAREDLLEDLLRRFVRISPLIKYEPLAAGIRWVCGCGASAVGANRPVVLLHKRDCLHRAAEIALGDAGGLERTESDRERRTAALVAAYQGELRP